MHLRGLVLCLLCVSGGARRGMRVGESHQTAQQLGNALANDLEVSAEAREALIPAALRPLARRSKHSVHRSGAGGGFGGGEATRDPAPTRVDPNGPKGEQLFSAPPASRLPRDGPSAAAAPSLASRLLDARRVAWSVRLMAEDDPQARIDSLEKQNAELREARIRELEQQNLELRQREEKATAEKAAAERAAAEEAAAERAAKERAAAERAEAESAAAERAEAEQEKLNKLLLSILIDIIGAATYLVPVVGEAGDVAWAPISAYLIYQLYGNGILSGLAFAEELLPGLDIVPTATIAWVLENTEFGRNIAGNAPPPTTLSKEQGGDMKRAEGSVVDSKSDEG